MYEVCAIHYGSHICASDCSHFSVANITLAVLGFLYTDNNCIYQGDYIDCSKNAMTVIDDLSCAQPCSHFTHKQAHAYTHTGIGVGVIHSSLSSNTRTKRMCDWSAVWPAKSAAVVIMIAV